MVNRDGDGYIPILDKAIGLFINQASRRSTLFGVSRFYDEMSLRQMLDTGPSQRFLPMIQGLIPRGVGFCTPNQAAGHAGIFAAVTNHMTEMGERLGRLVTRAEAHSDFSAMAGQRRVETAGTYRENLGRVSTTMSEAGQAAGQARVETAGTYRANLGRVSLTLSEAGQKNTGIPKTGASTTLVLHDKNADRIYYSLTDSAMLEKMVDFEVFSTVRTAMNNIARLKACALDGEFKLNAATKGRGKKSERGACGRDMPANLDLWLSVASEVPVGVNVTKLEKQVKRRRVEDERN